MPETEVYGVQVPIYPREPDPDARERLRHAIVTHLLEHISEGRTYTFQLNIDRHEPPPGAFGFPNQPALRARMEFREVPVEVRQVRIVTYDKMPIGPLVTSAGAELWRRVKWRARKLIGR